MKAEILKILRQAEGYLSGQKLCDKFGVSRTAVEAVRNIGYHIVDSPDVMTKE